MRITEKQDLRSSPDGIFGNMQLEGHPSPVSDVPITWAGTEQENSEFTGVAASVPGGLNCSANAFSFEKTFVSHIFVENMTNPPLAQVT
jgi:hypothetical protein